MKTNKTKTAESNQNKKIWFKERNDNNLIKLNFNKKAQATIFIIIALVIGATILGAYYTKEYVLKSKFEREQETAKLVPTQAQNIYDFTIDCIQQTADYAVDIIGSQAGYIKTPIDKLNPIIPIEKNTLKTIGNLETPYWTYTNANNLPTEQIPSKEQMQSQLSYHIDQEIKNCLNDYEDFPDFEIQQQESKTQTIIKANKVLIKTDLPLNIKKQNFQFTFKPFYTEVKKPLGYLYEQAIEIIETELQTNFLEEKTLDTIMIYDETPFIGESSSCIPPFWIKEKVIEDLKQIVSENTQFIKIKNTNYELPDDLKYFEVDTNINDKELDVNFLYLPNWPNEIQVNPEENGILKAQSVTSMLGEAKAIVEPFVCRSIYQFVYDIKIPILITLSKNEFTFRFATQTIIDHNEPRQNLRIPESIPDPKSKFCENKRFKGTVGTLSDNIPLQDVSIDYKCITRMCNIGYTKINNFEDAELTEQFPICHQGTIIATKQGYHPAKQVISTTEDFTSTINLEQYKTLSIEPIIQRAGSGQPQEGENIFIQLSEPEKQYNVMVSYPEQTEMQLIPGNYKIKAYLIKDYPEGISIPKRKIEKCIQVPKRTASGLLLGQTQEECLEVEIPSISIEQTITGTSESEITITKQDLTKSKIIFYVPYKGIPTKPEDIISKNEKFTPPRFE